MSARPSILWAAAAMASLALHGAVGMVLYAMPLPEPRPHGETEVTIKTLEMQVPVQAAAVSTISAAMPETANASSISASKAAAPLDLTATTIQAVQPSAAASTALSNVTTPLETGIVLPGSSLEPVEVQPSTRRMATAVSDTEAIVPQPATTAAAAIVDDDAGVAASSTVAVASVLLGRAIPGDVALAVPDRSEAPATADEAPRVAGLQPATEVQPDAASPVALDAVAPGIASGGPVPVAPSTLGATKTIPAALTAGVASAVAPRLLQVIPEPAATLSSAAPSEALGTEIAMLPRPESLGGPAPSGQGDAGTTPGLKRLPIAQFLLEEKDATDCLLALPTGDGLQQASIAAFSDAPEKVAKLGSKFERRSGLDLEASTYSVSRDQCGTLAFARDLAQYPDFPLRLTLSSPTIGSGQELAGTISGLGKDTLYLMVVDDEGKAELVKSYTDVRTDTMTFHAPMTLTSGPVSSAQLLVAVATDGPLRTVARRPGMPADVYFERLKSEIIADQRSIAYGIVGFDVR